MEDDSGSGGVSGGAGREHRQHDSAYYGALSFSMKKLAS